LFLFLFLFVRAFQEFPTWKNANEQLMVLRECNYDLAQARTFAQINWSFTRPTVATAGETARQQEAPQPGALPASRVWYGARGFFHFSFFFFLLFSFGRWGMGTNCRNNSCVSYA
jgi:hypothetical protein